MRLTSMSTLVMILALIIILPSCASKEDKIKNKKADLYFGAGTQSLMQKDYTDALKNLLKANELSPDSSEILNNLAMAYYFKGKKDIAIKTLKRSLEINENNSDAKTNLASIHLNNLNFSEARRIYQEVLSDLTYDKQARIYYNLGMLELASTNNTSEAMKYFKRSIKEDENYCPSYYQIGQIFFKRKKSKKALENFKEASIGTCYNNPAPHYYQALCHIDLRQYDMARLKLDDIQSRFKKSSYASMALRKSLEITELEKNKPASSHASRNILKSPEF